MSSSHAERWYLAAAAVLALSFAFNFAGYPLLDPDEGRNAEVMREMAASNRYAVPTLNGLPYVDKPVLYFAAGALGMEVLGPSVVAARLPSMLFTLATLALVAWFAARLFGREAGWIAALATAATPFTLAYSRTVIFDAAVMFWVVLAVVGFYESVQAAAAAGGFRRSHSSGWWRLLAWGALALGVLTKGPVALAVPLMIVVPYAIWRKQARALADLTSLLLFVALVLPWAFAMSANAPGYLRYVLVTETFGRLTTTELARAGPWWYFLAVLPAAGLPWSGVVLSEVFRRRRDRALDHRAVLLAAWIIVPLVFFTLSQSKRPQYVLPLMPAIGLAVAYAWTTAGGFRRSVPAAAGVLASLGAFLIVTAWSIPNWVSGTADIVAAIPITAILLGFVCVAAGLGAALLHQRPAVAFALVLPVAAIPFLSVRLMDAIGTYRSAAPLAGAIATKMTADTRVVAIETYPLSLPFYLDRPVILATESGRELTSNYIERHGSYWMRQPDSPLRPADWWRDVLLECARPIIFVIASGDARRSELATRLELIADTGRHAAYGPCGRTDLAAVGSPVVGGPRPPCCGPPSVDLSWAAPGRLVVGRPPADRRGGVVGP